MRSLTWFSSTDHILQHSNVTVDILNLLLHLFSALLNAFRRTSKSTFDSMLANGTVLAVVSVLVWRCTSALAEVVRSATRAGLIVTISGAGGELARLVRLEWRVG